MDSCKLRAALICVLWIGRWCPAADRPNIVILYADDLGYGDVQSYNPERGLIPTPAIDRLAAEGMSFTDAHSSSGVCSPSRYTLLTGRYHWRTRLQSGIVGLWGPPLIAADRLTIGGLAQNAGYRTACVGKWHLGWDWPVAEADRAMFTRAIPKGGDASAELQQIWSRVFSQQIDGGPITRGFDEYFGTDVPNWPPYCFIEGDRTVGVPSTVLDSGLLGNNQASQQGPALPDWNLEQILPALTDRACRFLSESAEQRQPFLLYVPFTSPHTPLAVNSEWRGRSGLNAYADLVMETDAAVGTILETLQRLELAQSTLVIFTSDNGCAHYIDTAGLERQGHFPSGDFRGYKSDAWEGGHRVPFIVRWPGVVQAGSTSARLIHQADVMVTIAEVLQQTLAADCAEDSFSMVPLLHGKDVAIREHAVSCSIQGVPALRSGNWKYLPVSGSGGWTAGGDASEPVQLYDLDQDPGERNNLAKQLPEKVHEMQQLLEHLITRGRSNEGARRQNDVRVRRYNPVSTK